MNVKTCSITILIFDSYSLKDKRSTVKSIITKVHNKYNVSIAEVDNHEIHNKSILGLSIVSNNERFSEQILQKIISFIEANYPVEIINIANY